MPLEILAAGFYFDIHNIVGYGVRWADPIPHANQWFRLIPTVLAAIALVEFSRLRNGSRGASTELQPWLYLHILAFAYFVGLSAHLDAVLAQPNARDKSPLLVLAWATLIPVFLLSWLRIFYPLNLWGTLLKQRRLALPAAILAAILAWIISFSTQNLWYDFHRWTFQVVHWLLHMIYAEVVVNDIDFIAGTPNFLAEIGTDCSGYEGMGLVSVFLTFYLWLFRRELKFPPALLILPISLTVTWLFNAFRITLLIAIGSSWSPDIAQHGFHSQAGWISFILVAFASMWLLGKCSFFSSERKPEPSAKVASKTSEANALIIPFLLMIAGNMLATAFSDGDSQFPYPVKIIATGLGLWFFRKHYRKLGWQPSWHPILAGFLVFAVWIFMEPETSSVSEQPLWLQGLSGAAAAYWLLVRTIGSILVVPIAEELFFRGYLFRKFVGSDYQAIDPKRFTWFSLVLSSLLFGLLHQRWLAGTIAGMIFAYVQCRRGKLSDAIIAHAITNALIAISVLCFGQWQLWS